MTLDQPGCLKLSPGWIKLIKDGQVRHHIILTWNETHSDSPVIERQRQWSWICCFVSFLFAFFCHAKSWLFWAFPPTTQVNLSDQEGKIPDSNTNMPCMLAVVQVSYNISQNPRQVMKEVPFIATYLRRLVGKGIRSPKWPKNSGSVKDLFHKLPRSCGAFTPPKFNGWNLKPWWFPSSELPSPNYFFSGSFRRWISRGVCFVHGFLHISRNSQ